ncbi:hypothetical protein [Enterococcus sp. AZ007]|uniref:hypothetical protein n=1 Tax=Enterococcus sp. AZ007 TaxID=2774839 RepID=UPI003F222401
MKIFDRFKEDKVYWVKFDVDPPLEPILWVDVVAKSESHAIELAVEKAMNYYGVGCRGFNFSEITFIKKAKDARKRQYICFVNDVWRTSGSMKHCLDYVAKYEDDSFEKVRIEPKG